MIRLSVSLLAGESDEPGVSRYTGQDMGWTDEEDPYGIVARYKKLMPSGSYLLPTHFSNSSPQARGLEQVLLRTLGRGQLRSREQITRFFDGLDLVEPGIVHLPDWHPDEPVSRPLDHLRPAVPRGPRAQAVERGELAARSRGAALTEASALR
jgi:S-adenosyl methyltransferase